MKWYNIMGILIAYGWGVISPNFWKEFPVFSIIISGIGLGLCLILIESKSLFEENKEETRR